MPIYQAKKILFKSVGRLAMEGSMVGWMEMTEGRIMSISDSWVSVEMMLIWMAKDYRRKLDLIERPWWGSICFCVSLRSF